MMEAIDPAVEGAVLNLLQTIMRNLNSDERMDAWFQQVGLADDAARLLAEVERVNVVMNDVKARVAESGPLPRSLSRLRDMLYNTDDVVDELDYFRLQQQAEADEGGMSVCVVSCTTMIYSAPHYLFCFDTDTIDRDIEVVEAGTDASRDNSGQHNRRSKAWDDFTITEEDAEGKPLRAECVHCHTSLKCETSQGTSVLHNHLKSAYCKKKRAANEQSPHPSR